MLIHRLVAEAFIDNPENKPCINHRDGIKTNYTINNIEWCTYKENNDHAYRIGLKEGNKGEASGNAKLTEADVIQIRQSSLKQRELAKIFGASRSHISNIKSNKKWKHVI